MIFSHFLPPFGRSTTKSILCIYATRRNLLTKTAPLIVFFFCLIFKRVLTYIFLLEYSVSCERCLSLGIEFSFSCLFLFACLLPYIANSEGNCAIVRNGILDIASQCTIHPNLIESELEAQLSWILEGAIAVIVLVRNEYQLHLVALVVCAISQIQLDNVRTCDVICHF